ncbi:MAG: hypothetical protein CM1200mP27_00260 [Chloroflexota bacterium]|nr:MAG: hypothetical protein CM1200mP27_00260 [Chloroflexota bacterium]
MGDSLLETYIDKDNYLIDLLTGLTSEERARPCYHPGSMVPAGNFVDLRFKEIVLHQWDIRSAIKEKAGLSSASLESMVILMKNLLPPVHCGGPSGLDHLDKPVRSRVLSEKPGACDCGYVVEGDKFRYEPMLKCGGCDIPLPHPHIRPLDVRTDLGWAGDF